MTNRLCQDDNLLSIFQQNRGHNNKVALLLYLPFFSEHISHVLEEN